MTPDQEDAVRRALAAATRAEQGVDPSLPADVAARLDGVLSELVRERAADPAADTPRDRRGDRQGDERRPRRPSTEILVAAAAVAVIAAAGGAVATGGFGLRGGLSGQDERASSSTAGGATAPRTTGAAPLPDSSAGAGPVTPGPVAPGLRAPGLVGGLPLLRSRSLPADVRRVAAAPASLRAGDATGEATGCVRPPVPRGADVVDVRLDDRRATLVLAPPAGGRRTALVYRCEDVARPLARVVVPAR